MAGIIRQRVCRLRHQDHPASLVFHQGCAQRPGRVKVAGVVWSRAENARALETTDVSLRLPEFTPNLCVEVRPKRNGRRDIQ